MSSYILPTATYNADRISFLDRSETFLLDLYDDYVPTPKTPTQYHPQSADPNSSTDSPFWMTCSPRPGVCGVHESSKIEVNVPLKCSDSVKKSINAQSKPRYPSLSIPSPSRWPTVEKYWNAIPLTNYARSDVKESVDGPSLMAECNAQVPHKSATPSLDGSLTSEDMDKLSCPSTPDIEDGEEQKDEWAPPAQLHPEAMETLHSLSPKDCLIVDVDNTFVQEMQQLVEPHSLLEIGLDADIDDEIIHDDEANGLPVLSIPSPNKFFRSLGLNAKNIWFPTPTEPVPLTSEAEKFYALPWESFPEPSNQIVKADKTDSPVEVENVLEIRISEQIYEYMENYEDELRRIASSNIDRTGLWISSQETYLNTLLLNKTEETAEVRSPDMDNGTKSLECAFSPSTKKSVRFVDDVMSPSQSLLSSTPIIDVKEDIFFEGFKYINFKNCQKDTYTYRQARFDAIHLNRCYLPKVHRDHLMGKSDLRMPVRPHSSRPVSNFAPVDMSQEKEQIIQAQREQQAHGQMMPAHWFLSAQKILNGGSLMISPAAKTLGSFINARILDIGGQPSFDWAWQVAVDFPSVTVHTVGTSEMTTQAAKLESPANSVVSTVPNLWTLPFPSNYFDVISARSLHILLKSEKPAGIKSSDEYDLCLQECRRCLKPGGYLEFRMIDADILGAGPLGRAASVEMGFNLKTRGYDSMPSRSFMKRLNQCGFQKEDVYRTWMVLPMAEPRKLNECKDGMDGGMKERQISPDGEVRELPTEEMGSVKDVAAITGLIGAWEWERWLIKLQTEIGKEEERLLEGIGTVLEEGARSGAGWRCLTGFARKSK